MRSNKIVRLNIGDTLYKYVSLRGIFKYIVIGIRSYKEYTEYEIQCKECKDHEDCELVVIQVDNQNKFQYVSMINNNKDDEKEQYYWHTTFNELRTEFYYLTEQECRIESIKSSISRQEKIVEENEKRLKESKEVLDKYKSFLKVN